MPDKRLRYALLQASKAITHWVPWVLLFSKHIKIHAIKVVHEKLKSERYFNNRAVLQVSIRFVTL
jgi:hypothetical protein